LRNNYLETKDWSKYVSNYEKGKLKYSLNNIRKAIKINGNPGLSIPAIQIIGTNGKGSITSFIENVLKRSSIKVGATTSPHLFDVTERIRINGVEISHHELLNLFSEINNKINNLNLTPFELITLSSLIYFSRENVDLILLEAGLGGRLDATTAHSLRPIIAIGRIAIDHQKYLGNDIKKITKEKLAVINKGSTIISCSQSHEVSKILEKKALEKKADLIWVKPIDQSWDLGLKGEIQRDNAAVAYESIKALNLFGWRIQKSIIQEGFQMTRWPGRMDFNSYKGIKILIDCAHNPEGAKQLSYECSLIKTRELGINWIIGIQRQKKGNEFIKIVLRENDFAWIVPIENHITWKASDFKTKLPNLSESIKESKSIDNSLREIISNKEFRERQTVITGSIFIAAKSLKLIQL
tara:strand:- start:1650 stop:2879 length:1230 start_codon:yes stop_codon:yes gene_type:complete